MKRFYKEIDGVMVNKLQSKIVVKRDGKNIYNPSEATLLADGWKEYIPEEHISEPQPYRKSENEILQEIIKEQYNQRTDISNEEALDRSIIIYDWESYIDKVIKAGQVVVFHDKVYRVRQEHTVQKHFEPDMNTASLYEVVELIASGEINDPISYNPPMEIFNGKYYTQNDTLYLCNRDSGTALTHDLSQLIGLYVELV